MVDINEIKAGRLSATEKLLNYILTMDLMGIEVFQTENIQGMKYFLVIKDDIEILLLFKNSVKIYMKLLLDIDTHDTRDFKEMDIVILGNKYNIYPFKYQFPSSQPKTKIDFDISSIEEIFKHVHLL